MKRTAVPAAGDLLFGPLGFGKRALAKHGDERVQLGTRLDALEAALGQLDG